ncbi:hypothetical protein KFE25_013042 [Diacronema lutheri]|uniref:Uncharacterized protein n=1 Tax=Diacronema lutheri TaxID=2081491 RepID=A0A8J5X6G5_DIALT|nr:hypothetical protein KFE25_013042 [Diacronema lutheri]
MPKSSKIKPKRSLASRKRAKNIDGAREGAAFATGLPEPLRPEVDGCMSRKLRDLLRRVGSLNPAKAEEVRQQREQRRAAAAEAQASGEASAPAHTKRKRQPGAQPPSALEPAAAAAPRGARKRKRRRTDGGGEAPERVGARATDVAARPAPPHAQSPGAHATATAERVRAAPGGARPRAPTAFKSGGRAKFGETNAAPPDLSFSRRLLQKAVSAHTRPGGAGAPQPRRVDAHGQTMAAARERERERALAVERERVIASYKAARAGPNQMQAVPAFVPRAQAGESPQDKDILCLHGR